MAAPERAQSAPGPVARAAHGSKSGEAQGRVRLDQRLVELGLESTRSRARQRVLAGEVWLAGRALRRPGTRIAREARPELRATERFVSRGGSKLAGALEALWVDPAGARCVDAGASTGGFTDCLLRRGARSVLALDVGHGQLDPALARDPRVLSLEGVNVRSFVPPASARALLPADLLVADLSFISLSRVLGALRAWVRPGGALLVLIKPQFELEPGALGRSGVVREPAERARAVGRVLAAGRGAGLELLGACASPLAGKSGNREVFALLERSGCGPVECAPQRVRCQRAARD